MSSPRTTPHDLCADAGAPAPRSQETTHCDLCGEPCDVNPDAWDAAGFDICTTCLEGLLDASTDNARAEVGLVGSGGGWS